MDSLIFLVGDLAHFTETLAGARETVFELEDFDLGIHVSMGEWEILGGRELHTCCSISRTLNSCPLNLP